MTLRLNLTLFLPALLLSLSGIPASAQIPGVLRGRIVDPMRGPIAGAEVTTVRTAPAITATTMSDQNGDFAFQLEPGTYVIRISSAGFADLSRRLIVSAGGAAPLEFVLQIAGFTQAVEVTGRAGRDVASINTSTKTPTRLRDVPQSVTVVTSALIHDQLMSSVADTVNYVPGITSHQGENNRDQVVIRGNSSSADFYVNGVRDDVQYYRDLYNVERVEALKGPNGMMFGRGGGGGVINRVTKQAGFTRTGETVLQAGSFGNRRFSADLNQPLTATAAFRVNGVFEDSDSFRRGYDAVQRGVLKFAIQNPATHEPGVDLPVASFLRTDHNGDDPIVPKSVD